MNPAKLSKNSVSTEKKYRELTPFIDGLIDPKIHALAILANLAALLKETFDKISWAGFYISKGRYLLLGPFQGKVACTSISFGKGVCGTAAVEHKTLIVADVTRFPGHIACDSGSKSEIVVPVIAGGTVWGVLDIDSYEHGAFNEIDKRYLEKYCRMLSERIPLGELL